MAMKAMKRIGLLVIIAAAFAGGYFLKRGSSTGAGTGGRKILYWVDPMHHAYKSDKPGVAPDCGMTLEPVYAGGIVSPQTGSELEPVHADDASAMPMGTVQIAPDKQ